MKKIVYSACLAVAVIGTIWWSLERTSDAGTPAPRQTEVAVSAPPENETDTDPKGAEERRKTKSETEARAVSQEVQERVEIMRARRPGRNYTASEVEQAMAREDMWSSTGEVATSKIPLADEQLHDGRQLVQFSPVKLESLQPGDTVKVDITEANTAYEVVIDRVEKHDYHSVSWYGHIDGNDGQRYQVSFTRGETLTVGGIDTPSGNYQLQAHDDAGWIASSGSLFVTSGETDAVYPPGHTPDQ
ncbi:hypothetical protein [Microbulbifer hydrolyticus]|uniref:Uncharacterized protein n=1 Tax=Microbulbifer hydrolyticus TaxID=48074 RepID=A0A6P1T8Q9_9GAMM|nr:hypothetical protein [Microbulbifer hydrolyticus]MBB5211291.1 hypothetical protein [Microbulbifer hydrolyticus]QHQ37946.1 hypothetical protein GTQ55_02325 [Microbulbifer hydrolyticus]